MTITVYDTTVQALQNLCEVPLNNSDSSFQKILPSAFEYADGRCYRELDFLATNVASSGTAFTVGNPVIAVPTQFINVRYMNVITPAATQPAAGKRNSLERVSPEFLDYTYPTGVQTLGSPSVPYLYAMYGLTSGFTSTGAFTIRVAPAPDDAYVAEFIGPVRPNVFSEDNPNTILTTRYIDLYKACCMIYLSGYQRDFGAQSSDPAAAMSWEKTYTSLRESIVVEAARQKSESSGWSTQTPSVLANQPRDRPPDAPAGP